jgi:hypothetical protein
MTSMTVRPSRLQTMTQRLWVKRTRQTASHGGASSLHVRASSILHVEAKGDTERTE